MSGVAMLRKGGCRYYQSGWFFSAVCLLILHSLHTPSAALEKVKKPAEYYGGGLRAKVVQELMRHASFRTRMDSYTQALDEPKRQAQKRLADLIMQTGKVGHA